MSYGLRLVDLRGTLSGALSIRLRTQAAPPLRLIFARCAVVIRTLTEVASSPAANGGRPRDFLAGAVFGFIGDMVKRHKTRLTADNNVAQNNGKGKPMNYAMTEPCDACRLCQGEQTA